ncbi:type II toxin-antitoxin system VapC family toxin, partial [Nostoc sp. UHCC 0252]|uniref:type II toxin-antitoxin system VapC family toxin n=1 Tax=Nostoc sp. UHCC 0252 TaxID=3110241 RepID=UPI002B386B08|nr:type II toxin-antitoxin system VapC family toxin [Nostoc sp. UHCC 0252]
IFLWFISGDQKLPIHLQNSIRDLNNDVYLSCVSAWEATVKYQLGKLPLPESPEITFPSSVSSI